MKSLVKVLLCLAAFSPLNMNAQFCGSCCDTCDDYYISVWGGGNVPFNDEPELDTGWYVGGAVGFRSTCSPCMRYDVSFDYLRNKLDSNDDSSVTFTSSSDDRNVSKFVVLANAYYDFCPCGCLVPFVGAGVGYAYIKSDIAEFKKNAFAWQVGGGVSYEINECWSASAVYRLLGTVNDHSHYHNLFGVALTRKF